MIDEKKIRKLFEFPLVVRKHLNGLLFDAGTFAGMNFQSAPHNVMEILALPTCSLLECWARREVINSKSFEKHLFSVWCEPACAVLNRKKHYLKSEKMKEASSSSTSWSMFASLFCFSFHLTLCHLSRTRTGTKNRLLYGLAALFTDFLSKFIHCSF